MQRAAIRLACALLPEVAEPARPSPTAAAVAPSEAQVIAKAKSDFIAANAEGVVAAGKYLLSLFIVTATASSEAASRLQCTAGLLQLLGCCSVAALRDMLREFPLCACIMTLLQDQDDLPTLFTTLKVVEELMVKLPDVYHDLFVREGTGGRIPAYVAYVGTRSGCLILQRFRCCEYGANADQRHHNATRTQHHSHRGQFELPCICSCIFAYEFG